MGLLDILFTVEAEAELAKAIPGATHSVIEKAAHSIHVVQPQALSDRVSGFLQDS